VAHLEGVHGIPVENYCFITLLRKLIYLNPQNVVLVQQQEPLKNQIVSFLNAFTFQIEKMNDFVSRIEEVGAEEISKALPTLAKNEERILELIQECITAFKAKVCKILRQDAEGLFIILFEQRLLSFVFLN
jgi:hypothetical protein